MICTNCNTVNDSLITDCYNEYLGTYISEKEHLCKKCAEKRGYKNLRIINNERNKNR